MLDKNFWNFQCFGCGRTLKVRVREGGVGETRTVECMKCGNPTTTIVGMPGVPAEAKPKEALPFPEYVNERLAEIMEVIGSTSKIERLAVSLKKDGFEFVFGVGVIDVRQPGGGKTPIMVNEKGEISKDAFNEADAVAFQKHFNIKL